MERITQIIHHPRFRRELARIDALERERPFCRHGIEHLLAVARLASLYALEEGLPIAREQIYAAALLHDIGRGEQYENGTPHEAAALPIAEEVLTDCGFARVAREEILRAISDHRQEKENTERDLGYLLYKADKKSRPCYWCAAASRCNWPQERRNQTPDGF